MAKKRVALNTLGCKVNQFDSSSLALLFQQRGYQVVDFDSEADVYVINTCSVTHLADRKSRQLIRRAAKANPGAIVAVTGCYAQTAPEEVAKVSGVHLVYGTRHRAGLVDQVDRALLERGPVNAVSSYAHGDLFEEMSVQSIQGRARAFLKIQDGCSNYCTYCIVPYARGPLRSRQPGRVIEAARKMVADGFKEIVLTGIHTGAYGRDLKKNYSLADLLKRLLEIPGLQRLRLSSIEPHDITLELVEIMSGSQTFCRHLHVPLQSGSDHILQRMGRRYTSLEYLRLMDVLKENIPGIGLTTDVMVGFPGESEEHFQSTCKLIKKVGFSGLHVFKFSPRQGTPAAGYDDQVEPALKDERSRKLIQLGRKLAASFASSHIGRELGVLVEQPVQGDSSLFEGLTDNYIRVVFPGREELLGQIVRVKAERVKGTILEGKIIEL